MAPKCRNLVWRICKGIVPIRKKLQRKMHDLDMICPCCREICPLWFASQLGWWETNKSLSIDGWLCVSKQKIWDSCNIFLVCYGPYGGGKMTGYSIKRELLLWSWSWKGFWVIFLDNTNGNNKNSTQHSSNPTQKCNVIAWRTWSISHYIIKSGC